MIDPTCRNLATLTCTDEHYRIDAFCVLTGRIEIGRRVHVSTGSRLLGSGGVIRLRDGSGVSMGSTVLTASDDFRSGYATGALFPEDCRHVLCGDVTLEAMAQVGAHCVVMPGCTLGFGSRLGANSFLTQDIPPGEIWAGSPARRIGDVSDFARLQEIHHRLFPA